MTLPQGADLGTTNDPKALILGDKVAVAEQATAILDEQRRIGKLLDSVNGLAIESWQGGIGQLQYGSLKLAEVMKLGAYQDVLKEVGTRLNDYSDALATAQGRAQDAIDKWNEGERATKEALADHNAAVRSYNDRVDAHNARMKAGLPVPAIAFVPPGAFVDPGEALREEAEEILEDARKELDSAGSNAVEPKKPAWAGSKTTGEGKTKGDDGILGALGKIVGGIFDTKADEISKQAGMSGELKGFEISPDGKEIQLFDASGEVHAFQIDGKVEGQVGDVKLEADGTLTLNSVSGEAVGKIDQDGLHLGVGLHQRDIEVEGNVSMKDGYLALDGKVYAYVGSDAEAKLDVGKDGAEIGFEAFSGAKAGIEGGFNYGGVGIGFQGEGQAGSGAAGGLNYGWKDGKLDFSFTGGLADGIGLKIRPTVELDFPEMGRTAVEIAENPDDAARGLAGTAGDVGGAIRDGAQWAVEHPKESGKIAFEAATAQPRAAYEIGKWALENPDEAAKVADGIFTNPIEQTDMAWKAGKGVVEVASEHPEAVASAVDKITIDAHEAKGAAKGVAKAIGGLF